MFEIIEFLRISSIVSMVSVLSVNLSFRVDDSFLCSFEEVLILANCVIVLDKYLDYFTTPYFIFLRDTLSYLLLLGLHIAICLSPATVPFSALEWVILVFFIGRFLSEVKQYTNRAATRNPKKRQCCFKKNRSYDYQQSQISHDEVDNEDLPIEVEDFRSRMVFSAVGKYFRYVNAFRGSRMSRPKSKSMRHH